MGYNKAAVVSVAAEFTEPERLVGDLGVNCRTVSFYFQKGRPCSCKDGSIPQKISKQRKNMSWNIACNVRT